GTILSHGFSDKRAPKARDLAGKSLGVSGSLVDIAKRVKALDPQRFEKVKAGVCNGAGGRGNRKNLHANLREGFRRQRGKYSADQAGAAKGGGVCDGLEAEVREETLISLPSHQPTTALAARTARRVHSLLCWQYTTNIFSIKVDKQKIGDCVKCDYNFGVHKK
ncbi:MAG: hypothetical protein N3A66_12525, partial [Planctomycetota bacterium]|nr:hypothetical protein [Planctomycetota bacterium]